MSNKRNLDLTNGPIFKTLAELALPIMASAFLGTAYNITDMAWIGMLGSKAVAGVGVGGMFVWLSQGLVSMARMGGQVHAAQCCGRNEWEKAKEYASSALQLTVIFGIIFAAICVGFTDQLISFFKVGDEVTFQYAREYMKIVCGFIIFSYMNFTLTGLYTAQGDSRTPFMANLAGLCVNMILDPVLILGIGPFPRMEVVGAAVATVSAQMAAFLVMLLRVRGMKSEADILWGMRLFRRIPGGYYRAICKLGWPTAIQGTLYCAFSMVLTRFVSAFGAGAIAVQRVGGQIEAVSWNTADGFGSAMNAFAGQNYGAKKYDRIRKGYSFSLRTMVIWGLVVTACFMLFPRQISSLFFYEEDVIRISMDYFWIIGICEPFMCVELMTGGALAGLGKTKLTSAISISLTGARIPLALLLMKAGLGLDSVWWALTISSVTKGIVFWVTFCKVSRNITDRKDKL